MDQKETKKTEKREFFISEKVDSNIEKIKKNVDYCNDNGIPDALMEGGKYYKAFNHLIEDTVQLEQLEIEDMLYRSLPTCKNISEKLRKIITDITANCKCNLYDLTRDQNYDGIKDIYNTCKTTYSDEYVKCITQFA